MLLSHQGPSSVEYGLVKSGVIRRLAAGVIDRFNVKASGPQAVASSLSGGNLQKYIIGREVTRHPDVLLVAQPTWGVDVGAAAQIRLELLALRDAGCALLVISEELDELFEISDRLIVIAKGKMSPAVKTSDTSLDVVGRWMSGLWGDASPQPLPGSAHV
jgi:simple sugar transport system ATP-binding protein